MGWTRHHLPSSVLALLGIVAVAGRAAPAGAEERPTVAVVVLPVAGGDPAVAREIRRQLVKSLATDPLVEPVDPLALASVPGEATEGLAFEALLQRGKEHLAARRYTAAIADLEKAAAEIRRQLDTAPKAALAEALVHLAAAKAGAGRRSAALAVLQDLLAWRPQVDLTVPDAPEGWDKLQSEARAWLSKAGTGSLMITSVPPRAEAFVDGRRLGPTPVLAGNLVAGTHFVSVRLEGHHRVVLPAEVRAGEERTVSVTLRPIAEHAAVVELIARLPADAGASKLGHADTLRRHTGATRLLLVLTSGEAPRIELKAWLYDLAENRLVSQTALRVAYPPRADELRALTPWGPVAPTGQPRPPARRWYRRWWVWTLATAAVATAVALPLGLAQRHDTTGERFRVQW